MTVFRCRICNHPFLAAVPPSRCPACGAGEEWVRAAADFRPSATLDLPGMLRENLQQLQALLVDNGRFYRAAAKVADDELGRALLQALTAVAAEQAGVVATLLGQDLPATAGETGDCSPAHRENLGEARQRVEEVLELGQKVLEKDPEDRVREVVAALVGAGRDHLDLLAG
jgi:rubredoxin